MLDLASEFEVVHTLDAAMVARMARANAKGTGKGANAEAESSQEMVVRCSPPSPLHPFSL